MSGSSSATESHCSSSSSFWMPQVGTTGGATCVSGSPNEPWSYTEEVREILTKYIFLRERMKPYITELMKAAHEYGTPVMRPLFYDFPEDARAWEVEDQYMFGPDVLVKPVTDAGRRTASVYLPSGSEWRDAWTGKAYPGGQTVETDTPLDRIPVFTRNGYALI